MARCGSIDRMRPSPEVGKYIDGVTSDTRRRDAVTLLELIGRVTGEQASMWGNSIVGFGTYHYRYESGREGDAPAAGFAPRKAATTIYLPEGTGAHEKLLGRLGEHTTGVVCLYIKSLDRVDLDVLERIVKSSYRTVTAGTFAHRASST
jgi:Domain of unknown function (DU1801)